MQNISEIPGRIGFGQGLLELGKEIPEIVALGADITNSVNINFFAEAFPERFFSMGIAEQNIAAVAAGMALEGKIPFFSTYGVFAALRTTDQIRISICYNNVPVKIGGAHAGISVGPDGATHQALEDIAIMRVLPNMTVLSPCDAHETQLATIAAVKQVNGPVYIRFGREAMPNFTKLTDNFTVGKSNILKYGNDISIFATGHMVWEALTAAKELDKINIKAEVVNFHTIKPIDKAQIIKSAKHTGCIITAEEHQITGGFGSAIAEVITENYPVKIKRIGINDTFGESGKPKELMQKYGLTAKNIFDNAKKLIKEKCQNF